MSDFTEIIKKVIEDYGDDVFRNSQKTHAILMDLACDQVRNRLLARHFVEAGGFAMLKKSGNFTAGAGTSNENALIIRKLREDFSLEANAAAWITHVFAEAMGLQSEYLGTVPVTPTVEGPSNFPDNNQKALAIGMAHTAAILKDGTAVAHGRNDFLQCDVHDWRHVKAIATGDSHTVGLLADNNSVVAVGRNNYDQCDVEHFKSISDIYAFGDDTFCVRQDGTVASCGKSKLDLSHFENIRSIAWHPEGVYGIRQDGRVMMSSSGWEEEDWALGLTNVKQILSTYVMGSLALTTEGRIYKMNEPDNYFAHLRDIKAMADLTDGFAVLRHDKTVRILPYDRSTPRTPSAADNWKNVAAIFGKYKRLIGLTTKHELLAVCTDLDWLRRNVGSLDFLKDWYPVGAADT